MDTKEILQKLNDSINEKREKVYKEMSFANNHNFQLEAIALRYKIEAYSDINSEVLVLLHNLK